MSEADFRRAAAQRSGILCVYYPPRTRQGRPILLTHEIVALGYFRVGCERWTDGGSVPRIAHVVAHPLGYLFPAFLVHDTSLFDGYGWRESNRRFAAAMRVLEAPAWQRWLILLAVGANGYWQHARQAVGLGGRYVD